jgi:uncharacterized protein (DUF362 family)
MNRRDFLKLLTGAGLVFLAGEWLPAAAAGLKNLAKAENYRALVCLAQGGNIEERLKRALAPLGGIEHFVSPGARVVLKPNVAWARKPASGANTDPRVVFHLAKLCFKAGAKSVNIYEHTCDNYNFAFRQSGIQDAIESAGGKIYSASHTKMYRRIDIPRGQILKEAMVIKEVLEADCFINIPVAKVHNAVKLSLGLKNLMGIVFDRPYWHITNLHQCIADFATAVKPQLTLVDATRTLLTNGPKGPGIVKELHTLIASADPVAADAYACTLFNLKPSQLAYIPNAAALGVGEGDLSKIKIRKE